MCMKTKILIVCLLAAFVSGCTMFSTDNTIGKKTNFDKSSVHWDTISFSFEEEQPENIMKKSYRCENDECSEVTPVNLKLYKGSATQCWSEFYIENKISSDEFLRCMNRNKILGETIELKKGELGKNEKGKVISLIQEYTQLDAPYGYVTYFFSKGDTYMSNFWRVTSFNCDFNYCFNDLKPYEIKFIKGVRNKKTKGERLVGELKIDYHSDVLKIEMPVKSSLKFTQSQMFHPKPPRGYCDYFTDYSITVRIEDYENHEKYYSETKSSSLIADSTEDFKFKWLPSQKALNRKIRISADFSTEDDQLKSQKNVIQSVVMDLVDSNGFHNIQSQKPRNHFLPKINWYESQYALVVGINRYEFDTHSLINAVNDGHSVAGLLKEMGFEVYELYDAQATREEILSTINKIKIKAGKKDNFLFYFAGHGKGISLENGKRLGYIIPYNAKINFNKDEIMELDKQAISLEALRNYACDIPSRHVAFLLDSCFSGLVFNRRGIGRVQPMNIDYYNNILERGAINILTAGDDQYVSDGTKHSPFTGALLEGLQNCGVDVHAQDGFATFTQLASYVKAKVEKSTGGKQSPRFDNLSGEDGDFLFRLILPE